MTPFVRALAPEDAAGLRVDEDGCLAQGPRLERVAEVYRSGGWPAEVVGDGFTAPFTAPSAGPPPWNLYRLTLHAAVGVASAEPHGATRWEFAAT